MESKPGSDDQEVICDFHKGCFNAMKGMKARLKLFKAVVARQMDV